MLPLQTLGVSDKLLLVHFAVTVGVTLLVYRDGARRTSKSSARRWAGVAGFLTFLTFFGGFIVVGYYLHRHGRDSPGE